MIIRFISIFFVVFFLQVLRTGAQENIIPATPAGKQFIAWLKVFNTGDRKTIKDFVVDKYPMLSGAVNNIFGTK